MCDALNSIGRWGGIMGFRVVPNVYNHIFSCYDRLIILYIRVHTPYNVVHIYNVRPFDYYELYCLDILRPGKSKFKTSHVAAATFGEEANLF